MDSYSQFTVHHETAQRNEKPETRAQQRIEIPSSWYSVKPGYGSYRIETRNVTVLGTVEVSYYGRRRLAYGKCNFQGYIVKVVKDSTNSWKAVDRQPVKGCIA